MADDLVTIRKRAAQVAAQQQKLREAVLSAAEAGLPIHEIAEAAGVTRMTVYRWREDAKALVHADAGANTD